MPMSPEARKRLSDTIRALRTELLDALHDATEQQYRLAVRVQDAGLGEAAKRRRQRLTRWMAEQERALPAKAKAAPDFRREAEKQAAYTLLNRLVLLKLLEAGTAERAPIRRPAVLAGGWQSPGYREFREFAPALTRDATEGYALLLQLIWDELAQELPGLYGPAGVAELIPVPPAALRRVVEALDDPLLDSCWTDDLTLGWVYQYWNDPEREALDARLNAGGKLAPHEIASKTQMFTERYMVDWLLQNSLGPLWFAICAKNGWTPDVQADGTLARLEARRADWRAQRAAGAVPATALMPLEGAHEARWAYYLPQPIPAAAVEAAPDSLRALKLLDPAVGSGHFLVVALDLLLALYREEARHRGLSAAPDWQDAALVEHILAHTLHGIDLDPRAVQIAAAALWLKARQLAPTARPARLNLVAARLRLAALPEQDEALVELRRQLQAEAGLPAELVNRLLTALRGADHLGSLLKVDAAVDAELDRHVWAAEAPAGPRQLEIFAAPAPTGTQAVARSAARASVMAELERFLARHTAGDDLGLRLRGEQLAAGVRFVRLLREGQYDLVVANPPYQGSSKLADAGYLERHYKLGKADLYAAFLLRGLELVRPGGVSAMLTMRGWMFLTQYADLRQQLMARHGLQAIGDVSWGAFREMRDNPVSIAVLLRDVPTSAAVAIAPTNPQERIRTQEEFTKKEAGFLCHETVYRFDPAALKVVPEWPLVYWWDADMLRAYQSAPLIGEVAPARFGLTTGNNPRFVREWFECTSNSQDWAPFLLGAAGREWFADIGHRIEWRANGLQVKVKAEHQYGSYTRQVRNEDVYFQRGVGFSMIGSRFAGLVHRTPVVIGNMGSSIFPDDVASAVCAMNSTRARDILSSLNPGVHFEVGDVNRLPLFPIADAEAIFARVEAAFAVHEAHREPSVEFRRPGPSPWRAAQAWAQTAVDRPPDAPLPPWVEDLDPDPPGDHLSHALGIALGRFAPATRLRDADSGADQRLLRDARSDEDLEPEATTHARGRSDDYGGAQNPESRHRERSAAISGTEAHSGSDPRLLRDARSDEDLEPEATTPRHRDHEDSGANPTSRHRDRELAWREAISGTEAISGHRAAVLDPARDDLSHALPHGLLFLDLTLDAADWRDSLGHPAATVLHDAWAQHGAALAPGRSLREWLALDCFDDVHRPMYDNRPIHWPLSSSGRRFVAWVQIHRLGPQTLTLLLADHLKPTEVRIEGELADLRAAREGADRKTARAAETRFQQLKRAQEELAAFIAQVQACADAGPPPVPAARGARLGPARDRDARYAPVLDDGVMINAAALWPLLDPQWREPKRWWQELALAEGRKDYDWARLAMAYWPRRVDGKCRADPSLAVAHGCFWRYHPARAWAWELRLQDEINADFRLDEAPYQPSGLALAAADADAARATPAAAALPNPDPGSNAHRAAFLATQPEVAIAAIEREAIRRMGRGAKRRIVREFRLLDAGLWPAHARTLWALELALATRQGAELLILAPDDAPARTALLATHPELAQERAVLLESLRLEHPLIDAAGEDEDAPLDADAEEEAS